MRTHEQWISMLPSIAKDSDDPDTQTACLLVSQPTAGFQPYIASANRLPGRVKLLAERLKRPAKYIWIQHAEHMVIAQAACSGFKTWGATAYLNWFPCANCAGLLVAAGIRTLYVNRATYDARKDDPRYDFAQAGIILMEGHVRLRWF